MRTHKSPAGIIFMLILTAFVIISGMCSCCKLDTKNNITCINTVITQTIGNQPDTSYINVNPINLMTVDEMHMYETMHSSVEYITINNIPVHSIQNIMVCQTIGITWYGN